LTMCCIYWLYDRHIYYVSYILENKLQVPLQNYFTLNIYNYLQRQVGFIN
jgi:hypothetical protein